MPLPPEKIMEIRTKRALFKRVKKPRVSSILKQTLKNLRNTGSTIKEGQEWTKNNEVMEEDFTEDSLALQISNISMQDLDDSTVSEFNCSTRKQSICNTSVGSPFVVRDGKRLSKLQATPLNKLCKSLSFAAESNNNSVVIIDDDDDIIFTPVTVAKETQNSSVSPKVKKERVKSSDSVIFVKQERRNRRSLKTTRTRVLKDMGLSPIVIPGLSQTQAFHEASTPKRPMKEVFNDDYTTLSRSENLNLVVNLLQKLLSNPVLMKLSENVNVKAPVETMECGNDARKNSNVEQQPDGAMQITGTSSAPATLSIDAIPLARDNPGNKLPRTSGCTAATQTAPLAKAELSPSSSASTAPTTCAGAPITDLHSKPLLAAPNGGATIKGSQPTSVASAKNHGSSVIKGAPATKPTAVTTAVTVKNNRSSVSQGAPATKPTAVTTDVTVKNNRSSVSQGAPATKPTSVTTEPLVRSTVTKVTYYKPKTNRNKSKPNTIWNSNSVRPQSGYQSSYHFISENISYDGNYYREGLRPIVIDGSNIAMSHGNGRVFSVRGLKICIDFFLHRGHKVYAFIPSYRLKRDQSDNQWLLQQLVKDQHVFCTSSREVFGKKICSYDDRILVQVAAAMSAVIVSCDNYRDLLVEDRRLVPVIQNSLLMPTWVGDMIIFPEDPLGRFGPKLNTFLRYM